MALQIPLNWMRDFVDWSLADDDLAERLTLAGLEVEAVEQVGKHWGERCFVAEITAVEKHPDADSLSLVTVRYGAEQPLTVVTGAPNVRDYESGLPEQPSKVALAVVGAMLADAYTEGHPLKKLKPSKIRGIRSEGMVCSELELGIGEQHEGILLLPPDAPTGALLKDYLGDTVLHFDIKGGFAHLLSILGVARETAALLNTPLKRDLLPDTATLTTDEQPEYVGLEITAPDLCSRYSAVLVRGLKVGSSPFWMQQRLLRSGMRPINNIVDITNYVMLELGQPLHAFDYTTLRERAGGRPTITIRRAHPGETITTLDEVERQLDPDTLLISDTAGTVGIAGVMGGGNSEVSEQTTEVLLEAANFEFLNNRKTSQSLKLRTEASERFGKRLDPEGTLPAALRAAQLMVAHAEGTLELVAGDLYPERPETVVLELDPDYVRRVIGVNLSDAEMVRILTALEFEVESGDALRVTVPSHRRDVRIPADLVEEITRIHGYNNMAPSLIRDELPPQRPNLKLDSAERIRDLLTSLGLDEIITYSMINPEDDARLQLQDSVDLNEYVPVVNPLSQERTHLRRNLIPGALGTARSNLRFMDRVTTFEVGGVFHPKSGQVLPEEPRRLNLLFTGTRQADSWLDADAGTLDFFDLKGIVEQMLNTLHCANIEFRKAQALPWHPGRCAELRIAGETVGHLGELHPAIRQSFGLPEQPVAMAEFDFDRMMALMSGEYLMSEISPFTPIYEDIALVVDTGLSTDAILPVMLEAGKPLLRNARLFDVYEGEQVGAGKKSLAYAFTYQAMDRTLTDKDVEKIRKRIVRKLEQEFQAHLRG
ncbi:MAG TPA: phenylalanine--tRNA ligase subunit beta [Deltaproteobacteria bacterium]|nr:phenylalanine--tRNA ligase subunit beta [Deltaproteobacteria bacterium]